jgi:hypothetical protein
VSAFAGDFLKDLQTEFQNWEAGLNSDQKPQSLWEELSVSYLYTSVACLFYFLLNKVNEHLLEIRCN